MTKPQGKYETVKGWECPICHRLVARQADMKKHFMRVHGMGEDGALEHQRKAEFAFDEMTSVRYYPNRDDRYSKNLPGGA